MDVFNACDFVPEFLIELLGFFYLRNFLYFLFNLNFEAFRLNLRRGQDCTCILCNGVRQCWVEDFHVLLVRLLRHERHRNHLGGARLCHISDHAN